MADLNSTIVRGKLRVTEDINTNGNIAGSSITLSSVKNTKVLGTNANGLIEAHTLGTSDITNLPAQLNDKVSFEHHNLSYGIFYRDPNGSQYTGIDGDYRDMRMFVTFDNTTDPFNSDPDIGYKMVDLGTVMSAGVNANDPQNFGGAIFANFIGPNNSVGEYSDLLMHAGAEASYKFREIYGKNLGGGFGCLDGTAKGSLFTSRIDSNTGDIYTSALMFKPNVNSNDPDFQASGAMEMRVPCFSIYNGIQVTTSGSIYNKNDVIDPLRDRNESNVAFLAYSKTGQNVDIDRIAGDYQPRGSYVTTNTVQIISAKKTFSTTPVMSAIKDEKVIGTDAHGLLEAHTLGISDITNLQTTLNNKQDKIKYPCSFDASSGNYVKLSRDGTSNYYVKIERGGVAYYSDSATQYPSINVTFTSEFSGTPTVVATFTPSSNSTGAEEAIKITNITEKGFTVNTRLSAAVSSGYFRVNWIAIYTF